MVDDDGLRGELEGERDVSEGGAAGGLEVVDLAVVLITVRAGELGGRDGAPGQGLELVRVRDAVELAGGSGGAVPGVISELRMKVR